MSYPKVFDDPVFQAMYERGQSRIDAMLAELPADGTIPLPFRCYGCDRQRKDFAMRTGDGLPLCIECLGFDPAVEFDEAWWAAAGRRKK